VIVPLTKVGPTGADIMPAAIIPVLEIGIQKFDKVSNIALDAAKVNPLPAPASVGVLQ
jgi:hypothetical protein